jgi:hypothetical protein
VPVRLQGIAQAIPLIVLPLGPLAGRVEARSACAVVKREPHRRVVASSDPSDARRVLVASLTICKPLLRHKCRDQEDKNMADQGEAKTKTIGYLPIDKVQTLKGWDEYTI